MSNREFLTFDVSEREYPNPYAHLRFKNLIGLDRIKGLRAYTGCREIYPVCKSPFIVLWSYLKSTEGTRHLIGPIVMSKDEYNNFKL